MAATFCKIRKTDCVFPFVYEGKTHNSCIKREDTFWCATKVNEDDLNVILGFWAKCDVDEGKTNCDPNWTPAPEEQTDTKTMGKFFNISNKLYISFYYYFIVLSIKHKIFLETLALSYF